MGQATVRVKEATRAAIKELARAEGRSMQAVIEKAVEEYRRRRFVENVNAAYDGLRNDPDAWAEVEAERTAWDQTLTDGLPSDEVWTDEGIEGETHTLPHPSFPARGGTQDRKLGTVRGDPVDFQAASDPSLGDSEPGDNATGR